MSWRQRPSVRKDAVKEDAFNLQGKNTQRKSPNFVPLNGLSQSAKDRQMNNKKVRPPKNLNLVEGDPVDNMESQRRSRQIRSFPNEHLLSSKIKEVNGMDYSNHSIEQFYRQCHSRSESPEISEDSANSSSLTNSSLQNGSHEEACVLNINSLTDVESSIIESDLPADQTTNPEKYISNNNEQNSQFVNSEELDLAIRGCRYSKNAAIMGLLKQNMISLAALGLEDDPQIDYLFSEDDDYENIRCSLSNEEVEIMEDNPLRISDSESSRIQDYPYLVPHPEDPEFYTTPLQAYGKIDDAGIDFRLPRLGEKTVMTPKQFFIREALNDDKFVFQKTTTTAVPKPKSNLKFDLPKINSVQSPRKENCYDVKQNDSFNISENDENDGFRLNRDEFPTLHR